MFVFSFTNYRKARRKERDGDAAQSDTKLYLEESVLELLKFTPADLRSMVDLPAGLDYNEWLASYSEYHQHHLSLTCPLESAHIDQCFVHLSFQLYKYLNM